MGRSRQQTAEHNRRHFTDCCLLLAGSAMATEGRMHVRGVGYVVALSLLACRCAVGFVALPPTAVRPMRQAVGCDERSSPRFQPLLEVGCVLVLAYSPAFVCVHNVKAVRRRERLTSRHPLRHHLRIVYCCGPPTTICILLHCYRHSTYSKCKDRLLYAFGLAYKAMSGTVVDPRKQAAIRVRAPIFYRYELLLQLDSYEHERSKSGYCC